MHSKPNYKCKSELAKAKESIKSPTEGEEERPQALDQSHKEPKNNSIILAKGISLFSKVRLFLSFHKVHITQEGIKFHTLEDLFPNQFHQPNKTSTTLDGNTQSIPTNLNTKLQSCLATEQCKKR